MVNRILLTFPIVNLLYKKDLPNLSYQLLGACFTPYNALSNLNTWLGNSTFSKLGGCFTETSSVIYALKNASFYVNLK